MPHAPSFKKAKNANGQFLVSFSVFILIQIQIQIKPNRKCKPNTQRHHQDEPLPGDKKNRKRVGFS
jgi:hypothetical protein